MATTTRFSAVNFGAGNGGLATVGYTLYNALNGTLHTARATAGVVELGTTTGIYSVSFSIDEADTVNILWDTGAVTPIYAVAHST